MYQLYKLSFASGKSYIGQTTRKMITRITQHRQSARNGSMLAVHCAWRMYGEPEVVVLGQFDSQDALHAAEIAAISEYKTLTPNGYNLSNGGETAPSKRKEIADKIAKKANGRLHSAETKAAMSDVSKAHWSDPSYREKVLSGVKASWTDEKRAARSVMMKAAWERRKAAGWVMPESTKEKLKAKVFSKETRAKMSASAKSRTRQKSTHETREKLRLASLSAWKDSNVSAKRVAAIKAAWTPERRAKMAEKAAELWKDPSIRAKRISAMKRSTNI